MKRVIPVVVALLSLPVSASAYFVQSRAMDDMGEPVPLRFDTSAPVIFQIDSAGAPGGDGSEYAAIAAAFQTWEDADCVTIDFEEGDRRDNPVGMHWTTADPADLTILVYWSEDPALFPSATVGFWDIAYNEEGTAIAAQVIFNSRHFTWATDDAAESMDIQSVATAGIGKILGISSTMEGNATYSVYSNGDTTKRMLGADDLEAIQFLYGDGATCPAATLPEMVCPTRNCPPAIIDPPDAGPVPQVDSGTMMMMGTDAGMMPIPPPTGDDDDGCSVSGAGTSSAPVGTALTMLLLVGVTLLRRRQS